MRSLLVAAVLLASNAAAVASRFVDYVHIEANEGGSSGGHSAIRFGDETYHFQHERPGVLRLRRDDWQQFRWAYGVLDNRTMHVSRVAVSDETYTRLRRRFNERYLTERTIFDHATALHDDRVLLELLSARRRGDASGAMRLRGVGFFFPGDERADADAAVALRDRVARQYGPDWIRARIDDIRAELARCSPAGFALPTGELPDDGHPAFAYTFANRYRDLTSALAALRALDRALPLRPESYRSPSSPDFALDMAERGRLGAYADRLVDELVRLLHSQRPDWGFAFLVGMARLQALRMSAETGRLVLLDAFPADAETVPGAYVRRHRDVLVALRADAHEDFLAARTRFATTDVVDEAGFAELESAGNRMLELDTAWAEGRELRVASGSLVPSREAPWSELIVPDLGEDELAHRIAQTTTAERLFDERLEERYGYDLFGRNCASEIFRTVDAAGVDPGRHVDTSWSLDFIPFVAASAVNDAWDVVEHATLRSYRRSRLADMNEHESPAGVWLREGNVVTSTIYRRHADDSFFLFFSDDVVWLRPAVGVINLAAGLGAAAIGLPLLPFDRGDTFESGVRGALFSLPELAFVSLRKGSFAYVPREERRPDG